MVNEFELTVDMYMVEHISIIKQEIAVIKYFIVLFVTVSTLGLRF